MPVFNIIALLGALVLVAAGGGGVWWWDRSDLGGALVPAPIRYVLPASLKHLPDNPASDLRTARQAAQLARDGEITCLAHLDSLNAQVGLLSLRSDAAAKRIEQDLKDAKALVERYRKTSASLATYQAKGPDQCARWEDADAHVKAAL